MDSEILMKKFKRMKSEEELLSMYNVGVNEKYKNENESIQKLLFQNEVFTLETEDLDGKMYIYFLCEENWYEIKVEKWAKEKEYICEILTQEHISNKLDEFQFKANQKIRVNERQFGALLDKRKEYYEDENKEVQSKFLDNVGIQMNVEMRLLNNRVKKTIEVYKKMLDDNFKNIVTLNKMFEGTIQITK